MLLVPRSYQTEGVDSIFGYFGEHTGNPIVAMPTGTGKSVVIAMFMERVLRQYRGQRILCLTHVKELIQQNYEKLLMLWPGAPAGINSAALGQRATLDDIIFAGIQSVAKYPHLFGRIDLVIVDEAHLISPKESTMYQQFINELLKRNPYLKVIGFTATPWRMGVGHLTDGGLFTDVCFDITGVEAFNRLIAEGYLSPLIAKKTRTVLDVDGVHMRGGEFIESELQAAVDKEEITRAALAEAYQMGHDRKKWLIFASGTRHSDNISQILEHEYGIHCPSVHSKNGGRDDAIEDLRHGRVRAVVNNNILTTGVDIPDIDFIVVLRPTGSAVLWVQMLGRGTRPVYAKGYDLSDYAQRWQAIYAGGKQNCLVGDFAGNTKRLGPINDPVVPRKKGEKPGKAPVRECPVCETYNHASAKVCINCGEKFPEAKSKLTSLASTEEVVKGELDLPVVEVFKVDHLTYSEHNKEGKPAAMKVGYHCDLRFFSDYVCPQHDGYPARKARTWWRERSAHPVPENAAQMLQQATDLKTPTHLRVWTNKKPYPQIMDYCYDGTAFGTQEAKDSDEGPQVHVNAPAVRTNFASKMNTGPEIDDDIPF